MSAVLGTVTTRSAAAATAGALTNTINSGTGVVLITPNTSSVADYCNLVSALITVVSDGTGGNRQIALACFDANATPRLLWVAAAALTQAASLTHRYLFGWGLPASASILGGTTALCAYVPLPDQCSVPPGCVLEALDLQHIGAGDTYAYNAVYRY